MNLYYLAAFMTWWMVAMTMTAHIDRYDNLKDRLGQLFVAIFWPVVLPMLVPMFLWRIVFVSARTIRQDLRNRKLMREFEEWILLRDKEVCSELRPTSFEMFDQFTRGSEHAVKRILLELDRMDKASCLALMNSEELLADPHIKRPLRKWKERD